VRWPVNPGGPLCLQKRAVGDVVRHILSEEKRYIDRLSNRPLTDTAAIPNGSVEALFEFGLQSHADLMGFVRVLPNRSFCTHHVAIDRVF
jgi:hypothetical protein